MGDERPLALESSAKQLRLGPKFVVNFNSHDLMVHQAHGMSHKDQIILHETVSPDLKGLGDIIGVEKYLAEVGYGIPGMTDEEGLSAWAFNLGLGVFWQCAGGTANLRGVGIENVSNIPAQVEKGGFSKTAIALATKAWAARQTQLDEIAKMCAAIHRTHPSIPLKVSEGKLPGVTTHYNVTHAYGLVGGHWDCWPIRDGGYFPHSDVVDAAKSYAKKGY